MMKSFCRSLKGSVDIEVPTDEGREMTTVSVGSVFVVPRGHWHRHRHTGLVKELYLTPARATCRSNRIRAFRSRDIRICRSASQVTPC
jgi:hypothetical protein